MLAESSEEVSDDADESELDEEDVLESLLVDAADARSMTC